MSWNYRLATNQRLIRFSSFDKIISIHPKLIASHRRPRRNYSVQLPCPSSNRPPIQSVRLLQNGTLEKRKDKVPSTICPSCLKQLQIKVEKSTTIEEKCKCPFCHSFIPTRFVVLPIQRSCDEPETQEQRRLNYFDIFDIQKTFDLDLNQLKRAYHRWQQVVHPDFSQHTQVESSNFGLMYMKEWSMLINQANETLRDDLKRAEYMIELDGRIRLSQETESLTDPTILIEIMEVREQLAEAQSLQEVESIARLNTSSITETLKEISARFKSLAPCRGQKTLEELKELVIRDCFGGTSNTRHKKIGICIVLYTFFCSYCGLRLRFLLLVALVEREAKGSQTSRHFSTFLERPNPSSSSPARFVPLIGFSARTKLRVSKRCCQVKIQKLRQTQS
ncbi:hypothetical protein O181_028339 [Austropuccinia psidii MF-1]|uniref:J domain-containing protein n=1 Tax=Austropuccinia psidii MF-1 TaxID=1389203 RepID=A0A9Q3CNP5_9BASI|nr:hypothetical protein [Austropuccinia psidii MF-1]